MNGCARSRTAGGGSDEDAAAVSDDSPAPRVGRARYEFHKTYAAIATSVGRVRADLARFARGIELPEATRDAVALAVSEAATNVVVHAYRESGAEGTIDVTAAVAASELWVIVTDTGAGLRPRPDSPGLGLGLAIIAQSADGVDLVRPAAGGLELRMRFEIGGRAVG
jgi:serine/threonine-protein kinase RsbW